MKIIALAVIAFGFCGAARADPCGGALPANGATFSGKVRYIVDGDGFCVGKSSNPSEWVEVRVANFYAPELRAPGGAEAKAILRKIAFGQPTICVAGRRSWDRTIATCSINGADIGDRMRGAGVEEGGNR